MAAGITLTDLGRLIPRKYRQQLLEGNVIFKAAALHGDAHMNVLFIIWTTFIDNSGLLKADCMTCLNHILKDFRTLEPALVQLEKEALLLELTDTDEI